VSRSKSRFNDYVAENNSFTICKQVSCKLRASFCAKTDSGTSGFGEFKMAGQEVCMKMCFENMGDCEIQVACTIKVLGNVTLGVYDDCIASGLIAHKVRSVGEALKVKLFKDHVVPFLGCLHDTLRGITFVRRRQR
jgi:hypothetical protein